MNERPEHPSSLPERQTKVDVDAIRVAQIAAIRALDRAVQEWMPAVGLQLERRSGLWVAWLADRRSVVVAPDDELDADDCLLQIVLHECCHWMVEGESAAASDDWGLDNLSDRHDWREHAALLLQCRILEPVGLADVLEPTTDFRSWYRSMRAGAVVDDVTAGAARNGWERWRIWKGRPALEKLLMQAAALCPAGDHVLEAVDFADTDRHGGDDRGPSFADAGGRALCDGTDRTVDGLPP